MADGNPKRLFAAIPLRAMATDLSGLHLRILVCVAIHDRMSLVTGKGQGCRASNRRMAEMVGCNYNNLCLALMELVALGFLVREERPRIGRLGRETVYQVVYSDADRALFDLASKSRPTRRKASKFGPDQLAKRLVDDAEPTRPIGQNQLAQGIPETGENPPKPDEQYIPLNGEGINSVETESAGGRLSWLGGSRPPRKSEARSIGAILAKALHL